MKTKLLIGSLILVILLASIANFGISMGLFSRSGQPVTLTIGPRSAEATTIPDYIVDGVNDDVQALAALNALPAGGGKLIFEVFNYSFNTTPARAINNVTIEGMGLGTYFAHNGVAPIFSAGTQTGWVFRDLSTDSGNITPSTSVTRPTRFDNVLMGTEYRPSSVRSTNIVVASSDAPANIKSQADIVSDGTNDYLDILAAFSLLPDFGGTSGDPAGTKKGKVTLIGKTFVLGARLDLPPLHDAVFDASSVTLVGQVRLDSCMDVWIYLGVVGGDGIWPVLDLDPRSVGPDGGTWIIDSHIYYSSLAGNQQATSGAIGLRFKTDTNSISYNVIEGINIHGFQTLAKSLNGSGFYGNVVKLGRLYTGVTGYQDGESGASTNYNNRFEMTLADAGLTTGASIYGDDSIYTISSVANPVNPVILQSGAQRNTVIADGRITTVTDNSGTTTNSIILTARSLRENFYQVNIGTEPLGYAWYSGVKINTDMDNGYVSFRIPDDYRALSEIKLDYLALGSVTNMVIVIETKFGASGEAYNAHSGSSNITRSVTTPNLYEDDISGAFTGMNAGDIVGVYIYRPSSGNTDALIIGIRLKYQT